MHINDTRAIMLEQLRSLRTATPEQLESELKRAKGVSELAQVMVNTARVEVDYLAATGQEGQSAFLQSPLVPHVLSIPGGDGIRSITQHRLRG